MIRGRSRASSRARLIAVASLVAFALLTVAVGTGVVFPFDAPLLAAARTLDGVPMVWEVMSQSANFPLIAIAIVLVLWLIRIKRYREAVLVFLILAAVTAGSEGVKQLTGRPRPSGSGDGIPGVVYSYPSGHVLEVMTILGLLVVRAWRSSKPLGLRLAFAGLVAVEVILVAIARLALNEHYPTDLLAGFLGALGALGWYAWLTRPGGWADVPEAHPHRAFGAGRRSGQGQAAGEGRRHVTAPGERAGTGAGPTTEAGPLGRVDPARPGTPTTVVRPPLWSATATVVVGMFGLVASLVVLGVVAAGVRSQEVFALDTWATPFLHGIASPGLDVLMNALTTLGTSTVIVPALAVVVAVLLWRRRPGAALFLGVVCLGALVLNATMKVFFQRPRPSLPWANVLPDYSFPSGHTMNAVVFYLALALILWSIRGRRAGLAAMAVAIVIVLGVGISRIYLGYHYLTDVVGGLLAGIALLLVVGTALRARPAWRQWHGSGPTASRGVSAPGAEAPK